MRKSQISLFELDDSKQLKKRFARVAHGGGLNNGKRKIERPVATKRPMHVTFHSKQARGPWSFLGFKNKIEVENIVRRQARRHGVKIQDYANAGNHLHVKTKAGTRQGFQNFLRSA